MGRATAFLTLLMLVCSPLAVAAESSVVGGGYFSFAGEGLA